MTLYEYRFHTEDWEYPNHLDRVKNVAYEKRHDYVTIATEDAISAVVVEALLDRFVTDATENDWEWKSPANKEWYPSAD